MSDKRSLVSRKAPATHELNLRISNIRVVVADPKIPLGFGELDLCLTYSVDLEETPTIIVEKTNPAIMELFSNHMIYEVEKLLLNPEVTGISGVRRVLF
jgi:hypothetical protein